MPEKYADRAFYTAWAVIVVWALYVIPAIIAAFKVDQKLESRT